MMRPLAIALTLGGLLTGLPAVMALATAADGRMLCVHLGSRINCWVFYFLINAGSPYLSPFEFLSRYIIFPSFSVLLHVSPTLVSVQTEESDFTHHL